MAGLNSSTRKLLALLLGLTVLVLLVSIGAWVVGFLRLSSLQVEQEAAHAEATRFAQSGLPPTVSPTELERIYRLASTNWAQKHYEQALPLLQQAVLTQPNYKDAALLLFLSYKALGEVQANDLKNLKLAAPTFSQGLNLAKTYSTLLENQFNQKPDLVTSLGNYQSLIEQLNKEQSWADHYNKGNENQNQANPATAGWWNPVLAEWEMVYQANPNYLRENPTLWISTRLADLYKTKATYLCRVTGDYSGAVAAINRAVEIGYNSKVAGSQLKNYQDLYEFIRQEQCQTG